MASNDTLVDTEIVTTYPPVTTDSVEAEEPVMVPTPVTRIVTIYITYSTVLRQLLTFFLVVDMEVCSIPTTNIKKVGYRFYKTAIKELTSEACHLNLKDVINNLSQQRA